MLKKWAMNYNGFWDPRRGKDGDYSRGAFFVSALILYEAQSLAAE